MECYNTNMMFLSRKGGEKPSKAGEKPSYGGRKPGVKSCDKDGSEGGGELGGGETQAGKDGGEGGAESKSRGEEER